MALYGVQAMMPGGPDEDLLSGMAQTRSANAGNLQAAQAAMGGLGQSPPGSAGGGGGPAPPSMLGRFMQSQRAELAGVEGSQQGLLLGQRLLQVLDPRLPKPARQFLYRELVSSVGIDPKGDRAKQLGQMLTSLDPQSLEGIRRGITEQITSNPSGVPDLVRGVVSGQVPIDRVISGLTAGAGARPGAAGGGAEVPPSGGPPPSGDGAVTRPSGIMGLGGPGAEAPPPGAPGRGGGLAGLMTRGLETTLGQTADTTRTRAPGRTGQTVSGRRDEGPNTIPPTSPPTADIVPEARNVPPILREIHPDLAAMLGLDPAERYRNIDVIRGGHRNIPTDPEGQSRMAQEFRPLRDGVVNSIVMGNQLVELFHGRPETLNINLGRVPRLGEISLPNPASVITQVRDFSSGISRLFGGQGFSETTEEGQRRILDASRSIADRVVAANPSLQDVANANAQIQSLLINMAFAMAASKGQTGRFLSDRDVELQLQELGRTSSPTQFESVVNGVMSRIYEQYRVRTRSATGGDVSVLPALTPEAISVLINGRVTPNGFRTEIEGAGLVAPPTEAGRGSEIAPPGRFDSPPSVGDRAEALSQGEGGASAFAQPDLPFEPPRNRREVTVPEGGIPYRTLERTPNVPTIQQEEGTLRERTREDRALRLEERSIARQDAEIRLSAERRAARGEVRAEEELRRKRIHEAFQALAGALTRNQASITVPSGGGEGGAQDAAAFRITPPRERRAPTPIDASRYQPQRR